MPLEGLFTSLSFNWYLYCGEKNYSLSRTQERFIVVNSIYTAHLYSIYMETETHMQKSLTDCIVPLLLMKYLSIRNNNIRGQKTMFSGQANNSNNIMKCICERFNGFIGSGESEGN